MRAPQAVVPRVAAETARVPANEGDLAYADAKRWVGGAAALLLAGVALVATGDTTLGPWVTVAGMATAALGAHKLGRSGPEAARQ